MTTREVKEGKQPQGVDESVAYTLTTTPWGSTPTSVAVTAYDITAGAHTDVSTTVLTGSASTVGDVITTPKVGGLTAGNVYRIEVKFTVSGNTFEAYFVIGAEQ